MFDFVKIARDPSKRGFMLTYRENETNTCPGCAKSHWYVGRVSAECHFCGVVLPLPQGNSHPFNANAKPVLVHSRDQDAARGRFTVNSRS
jgi:hypothetical protein